MIKKIAFLSVFSLAILPLSTQAYYYPNPTPRSGINYITVSSCEQVGQDIRISRSNGRKYVLTSTTRNAGHGLRNYKLICMTNTQYKVEWTEASPSQPADTTLPAVSISSPQTTYINGSTFNINVSASDNIGIVKIDLYRDGVLFRTVSNQNQLNYSQTANINLRTSHAFYARAYDAAGNTRQSGAITIYIVPSTTTTTSNVSMTDSQYVPRNVTVRAGTTVVWRNNGSLSHTVTADSGTFSSGILTAGQTYSRTFNTTGTFPYYCMFHGAPGGVGMSGMVTVIN